MTNRYENYLEYIGDMEYIRMDTASFMHVQPHICTNLKTFNV
jgi:hypothetical protein